MRALRVLDLACGAGGCSAGYVAAGFEVVGVDKEPQPRYPFEFHQLDMLKVLRGETALDLADFDLIHASPPCQSETELRHLHDVEHEDLLTPTLALLAAQPIPWVVENVESTRKMPGTLILCGASFGLGTVCRDGVWRPLKRHRRFASSELLMGSGCACSGRQPVGVYGNGGGGGMTRGYKGDLAESKRAMGIDWMNRAEISQAIPPRYTAYLGEQLAAHLSVTEGMST